MTNYQRSFIPGGTYFFTIAVAERSSRILTDSIELLRSSVISVKHGHVQRVRDWSYSTFHHYARQEDYPLHGAGITTTLRDP